MKRVSALVLLLVMTLAVLVTSAGAQTLPSLTPGMPLPPGVALQGGWTYDQGSGQFRPPAGMPASIAAQSFPNLMPGMPLPSFVRLPPGWTYDQASGRFRSPAAAASQAPPTAQAPRAPGPQACADLNAQTAGLERDAQALRMQAQEVQARLQQLEQRTADARRHRDQVCAMPGATTAAPAPVGAKTARLPLSALAQIFNATLQGTQIRLHNYQNQDSWVQFGPPLGNVRMPIQVGAQAGQVTMNNIPITYRYYLNDLRSSSVGVDYSSGRYVLVVAFGTGGPMIIVDPIPGTAPPQLVVSNVRVTSALTPAPDAQGRPSYGAMSTTASGDVSCGVLTQLCSGVANLVRGPVQQQVGQSIQSGFGSPDVKSRVGSALRAALDSPAGRQHVQQATGVVLGRITLTRFEGDALVLYYE
jgi:hypothetical protein